MNNCPVYGFLIMIKNKRIRHLNIWKRRVLGTGILNLSATDI